jgi:hypothetical protein
MAFSATKPIEVGDTFDSLVWDSVLLGNGSATAVVWGDLAVSKIYLSLVSKGGTVGTQVLLNIATDSASRVHVAAVDQNRFAVVVDSGASTSPTMVLYDSAGTVITSATFASTTKNYSVTGFRDGTYLVKWTDTAGNPSYTHYNINGTAIAGQSGTLPTTTTDLNTAASTFAGDNAGGFAYSSRVSSNAADGTYLKHINSAGTVDWTTQFTAGYRGSLVFDGTNYEYFYGNTTNNQVYMQKLSTSGALVGSAITLTGVTSTFTANVRVLPNGNFLLEHHDQLMFAIVSNAGAVLDSYTVPANVYGTVAATTDSGALWIENYQSSTSTAYDLRVSAFDSVYLAAAPSVTTPTALGFTDTTASDTFSPSTAATLSVSSSAAIATYGIQGGTTGGSHTVSSVNYDVSKAGSYGTLYLQSSTGKYIYEPVSASINALSANASEGFTLTASNAAGTSGSTVLSVNVTGVNDLPLIGNVNASTQFTVGASNPATDNANVAASTVAVTDVDSANFASGYLQVNQSAGATDGYFFTDVVKVKSGTTAALADARFSAGENVYTDISGSGTFTAIGTVAASGGVLHIDFNASATPAQVAWLLKYLTYGAPTGGQRDFNVVVNDGDGGTSAASSFSMSGVDRTAPTFSSATPADDATGVSVSASPAMVFSESVKFGTGKIYLVDVAANTVVEQFDVATAQGTTDGKVSISGSTLTINPTAALSYSKAYAIKMDATAITDIAGNAYAGITNTTTYNFTTAANPPSVTITSSAGTLKAGQHATISFTFSATPQGFTAADVDVTGGTLTGLTVDSVNDKLYTADFAPTAAQSLSATVQVTAGKFTNATSDANVASNVLSISGDTLAPTVASIVRDTPAGSPTNADSLVYLVTFSEAVSNLDASDFSVSGSTATVSSVTSAGGNAYKVTVSGGDLATVDGTVSLAIASGNNLADAATNALGSTTPTGANQSYVVDNTVAAPGLALAGDTGASGADGITSNGAVNVALATDVSSWEYSVDGGAHWSTGTGTSFSLAAGSYAAGAINVRQTDLAGNLSSADGNVGAITIDTSAPAPSFALHADSGGSASDGITSDGTVDVTLPGDTGSWEYSIDSGAHWSAGSGTSFTLAETAYATGEVKVRYTDLAGNLSAAATNAAAITVDATAAAPGIALAADTGASGTDGITKNGTVNVTLPLDAASWEYSVDGGTHWSAGSGASFSLAGGAYAAGDIKARYIDVAGNQSGSAANGGAITVDTTVAAPALALAADTGVSSSDGITKNTTVNVTLATDVGSWQYSTDGGAHWSAGSGASFTLAEGSYAAGDVQVRQTDIAGNLSAAASSTAAIEIDTSAAAPSFALHADSGSSASDRITSDGTVDVTLPLDTASWEYSVDSGAHWSAGSGTSFTLAEAAYAVGAIKVRYTDVAGNLSAAAGNAAAIAIDQTVAVPSLALPLDAGASNSDGITNNTGVTVTLATDVASWEYSVDGGAHWSAGSGTSFTLAQGIYAAGALAVRQTDIAGNQSNATASAAAITIDTTAAAPSFALHADTGGSASDGITKDGTVDVTLPVDSASWEYSIDSGAHWAAGSGASFALAEASYAAGAIEVRYTDIAGNTSAAANNAAAVKVDQTIAAPALALAADTGGSNSDALTKNTSVNVTLATDAASWEFSSDGGAHWSAGSGTSFTLSEGSYAAGEVKVRQTDIAGNLSAAAANTAAITIDTTAAAPSLALASDSGASASDGITSNGTVNVTLPLDAASWEYSIDSGAHWTAGSSTSFSLAEGSYAIGAVRARYTDNAGNVSTAGSNAGALTVDTTAAAPSLALAADTGSSNSDGITKNPTVNVTLPLDANSWQYSVDGGAHWNTGSGAGFDLAAGTYAAGDVKVRYTDVAGNQSSATGNAGAIIVDTTVAAPAFALAADTGASSSDGITSNTSVNVTLATDVASWEVSVDGGAHWSAGSGTSFSLAEGSYAAGDVQVRQADIAGNLSAAASNTGAIKVDTTAAAPSFALHIDSGSSASDRITSDGTIDVTLPLDTASWEYSVDGGAQWNTGSGTSFTLSEGSYASGAVKLRYTDLAGNQSTAVASAAAITIDQTVASPSLALVADTGASSTDGVTKNTSVNVTLATDAASWEYSTDSGAHWNAGSGTSFTLAEGAYAAGAVKVRQTDTAGNLSAAAANTAAITIDTTAAAPSLALHADTGSSASDGITSNATVDVTLPIDAASWEYSVDAGAHWNTGSGTSFSLAEGSYAIGAVKVRYTDVAGNASAATGNTAAIKIDQTVAAPAMALATDTGASNSDGVTNNTGVNVTLATDTASWEFSSDGGAHWNPGSGTSFTLGEGVYAAGAVQVRQTDIAGNLSAATSNAAAITIDTTAGAPSFALHSDSGSSASDGITSDGGVDVTLPLDSASWQYSVDSGAHWNTGSGTSFILAEASYAIGAVQVRYTDVAGNASAVRSNAAAITVDQTAAAPALALAADTGASSSDGITNNPTVNVTLPADRQSWEYSVDGGAHWNTGSGASFDLAAGTYAAGDVKVRYTDVAGNQSSATGNAGTIILDTTAAAPAFTLAADTGASSSDRITNNPTVNVTLAADAASWEVSVDGGAHWSAGSGTSFSLAEGSYAAGDVQVRQTDIAGNLSAAASHNGTIQVDTTAAAPSFALHIDSGSSASDGITSNGTIDVTLPADTASWEYSVDAGAHWNAGSGTTFTLSEGGYASGAVKLRYTDLAGNQSTAVGSTAVINIDQTVAAPSLALAADTGTSGSDGVTKNTSVNVTLAGDAASWEYSTDNGSHWNGGSGTSFVLGEGAYAAGAVKVRQTDTAGNLSVAAANTSAIAIDTTAVAPLLALHADTGNSTSDSITNNATVDVTLPFDAVSWEYSVDAGAHWNTGSGASFSLAAGSYAIGAVMARYTDVAGNASAAMGNTAAIKIDQTVAAPAMALAADTGAGASDGVTNNTSVNVTLAADMASWEFSSNGGAHWNAGSGTSFTLGEGVYAAGAVQVRQTDIAGNLSTATANAAAMTIDTTAAAPALALAADTGASNQDGITNNASMAVSLPLDVASWEWSVDGGAHWSAGSGSAFTLADGAHAAGSVRARYTDVAGNLSAATFNAATITVDRTVTAPALALAADTGTSNSDGLTSNSRMDVTLAPDAASWEYSTNGGARWNAGAGASFNLADGRYASGTVQVRQTDIAGNTSAATAYGGALTIDTSTAAASLTLAADTGVRANDGITSDGTFNVGLPSDVASWEYSVDGGNRWVRGNGTKFVVDEGKYDSGAVQVRYTDRADNLSPVTRSTGPLTVDHTALAATLALVHDTGANATDGVTADPALRVSLPSDVDSWEYSLDSGGHWARGNGINIILDVGSYAAGVVQVRYTDLAGNHSPVAVNATSYRIERAVTAPPHTTSVDGVPVETNTVINSDGSTSALLVVPVVLPTRVDDTGSNAVADIPLIPGTNGAPPPLTASLPVGYGMEVVGSIGIQTPADGINELIRGITANTVRGSSDQSGLIGNGTAFLAGLADNTPIVVESVKPVLTGGTAADNPLVISAPAATPGSPVTALVIDGAGLPVGTGIQLENVNFAALIGPLRVTGGDGQQLVFGDAADQYIVLGPDDDILHGGDGDDIVGSEGGNDQIFGDAGNDLVFGGIGNDIIDGGSGTDTVLFQGASRADYSFRFVNGRLVTTQLHGGPDGTDTIANVELLRFAGAAPDMGADATLRRVYDTLFDRAADKAGGAYWSGLQAHGMSIHDIAAALLGSGEAATVSGLTSNAAFVDRLYLDALGAQPLHLASSQERAHWVTLLDGGKADRADVLVGIANSPLKLAADASEQSEIAFSATDAGRLVRLYETLFARHADEAGVNYWIGRSEAGMQMRDIANAFLQSAEAQQHYANGMSDDSFVQTLYSFGLNRSASSAEISYWATLLHSGALNRVDMLLYFNDSAEQITLIGNSTSLPMH